MITGKGRTLEHIAQHLPDVPVPPFARLAAIPDVQPTLFDRLGLTNAQRRKERRLARSIGYPMLVRSDAEYEDGLKRSFAGLFDTTYVASESQFDEALKRVRNGLFERSRLLRAQAYARSRGLEIDAAPIDVLLQRYVPSRFRAVITEHPNVRDGLFIDVVQLPTDLHPREIRTGLYFPDPSAAVESFVLGGLAEAGIIHAIRDYFSVRDLFPDEVVYQAEVLLDEYAFVQWRPFRQRQIATFSLDDVAPKNKHAVDVSIPIGVTPREGLLLHHSEFLATRNRISEAYVANATHLKAAFFTIEEFGLGGQSLKYACAPWQGHDLFRFAEQDVCFGFTSGSELGVLDNLCREESQIRYWSDGTRGRIFPID